MLHAAAADLHYAYDVLAILTIFGRQAVEVLALFLEN